MRNKWLEKLKCWFSICFAARFPFSLNLKFFLPSFSKPSSTLPLLWHPVPPRSPHSTPCSFHPGAPHRAPVWALAELRRLSRRRGSDTFPLVTPIWSSRGRVFNEEGVKAELEAFWGRLPSVCSSAWKSETCSSLSLGFSMRKNIFSTWQSACVKLSITILLTFPSK